MSVWRSFECVKGKCMSFDVSSVQTPGASAGISSAASASSSETEDFELLVKMLKGRQEASEKVEIAAVEEGKQAELSETKDIDMTKNVNLSSLTFDALLKSNETEER